MVNVNSVYGSGEYLKAADLQNQKHIVTIESARLVKFDSGEQKLCLQFVGRKKNMLLNKTNSTNVASMYGPESDGWIGKSITLYSTFVDFQGQSVPAVRIEPLMPQSNGSGFTAQAPVQQQVHPNAPLTPANEVGVLPGSATPTEQMLDDEVPF